MNGFVTVAARLMMAGVCLVMAQGASATPVDNELFKLTASDGTANDQLGRSVAVDGDTAVVGAHLDDPSGAFSGSAYVFVRNGTHGTACGAAWCEHAKLSAADGAAGDGFGFSVALDGDTAVIAALDDDDLGADSGSAYVFVRDSVTGSWSQEAKLTASDGVAGQAFGFSVDMSGGTVVIGANEDATNGTRSGAAYVFVRDGTSGTTCGTSWCEQAKLLAADGEATDFLGTSVGVDGDTALIGAYLDDDLGASSGSAYVYIRDPLSGTWNQQAKLTASDGLTDDRFGRSVALDADTAVVGAHRHDANGSDAGAAYVFTRSGGLWTEQAKLLASDGAAGDDFGFSVAVDGNAAVVGAFRDDVSGLGIDSGSAYVFTRSGGGWTEHLKLLASDGALGDWLGFADSAVSISGQTVVAGASRHDLPVGTNAGAAYVFDSQTDDQGPLTTGTAVTPNPVQVDTSLTITATVDDSATGGSDIAAASYTIDGVPYPMVASDGDFDEVTEYVTATLGGGLSVGVYEICVSGTDAAGNTGPAECVLLAVYDPGGGFVTGGGWIDSPSGAYVSDPSLTGKAKFGFVSKYQQGASVPTGQTQFQFKVADLNFHSGDYEWLVVSGAKAQYKGTGTINGVGNYGFKLFALDAELTPSADEDRFRIKIWDKDNGDALVYDNEIGTVENEDPVTEIGGGSIIVHKDD